MFIGSDDFVLTPIYFVKMAAAHRDLFDRINEHTEFFFNTAANRDIWERYINDPFWKTIDHPQLSLDEEFIRQSMAERCLGYSVTGFEEDERAKLIKKYFNFDLPVVSIYK